MDVDSKVQALSSPRFYDHWTRRVDVIETHFAWLFLTDDFAYKLKKPVRAQLLDQTTLAARYRGCCEEIRLNRWLAPQVYLGVVSLTLDTGNELHLYGRDRVVDWLVKMRRLPDALMLDHSMRSGSVTLEGIESVAHLLADFYSEQVPLAIGVAEYLACMRCNMADNRTELLAPDLQLPQASIETLHRAQLAAFSTVVEELGNRAANGHIIEAHGDLRPEHIYLGVPPCVIDALEFSADLRTFDPVEELAFLSVECMHAGHQWIGATIVEIYRARLHDAFSPELFGFYCSLRATTRAKIVAWHLRDPEFTARQPWAQNALRYVDLALDYALAVSSAGATHLIEGKPVVQTPHELREQPGYAADLEASLQHRLEPRG